MKKGLFKKTFIGSATALGIIGLSTPAVFAWDGNSGHSTNYKNTSYIHHTDYHKCNKVYYNYSSYKYKMYDRYHKHSQDNYYNHKYDKNEY